MATIVAVDCRNGALIAGDRQVVEGGTVVGSRPHVFAFDGSRGVHVGAAAVGEDPDAFRGRLDAAIREYGNDRLEPQIDAVARMADEVAGSTGVEALVAARDDAGLTGVRSVSDGVLVDRVAAFGSAAPIVLGHLAGVDEVDLDDAHSHVRGAFRAATSRDAGTGSDIDVWRLSDAGSGETV